MHEQHHLVMLVPGLYKGNLQAIIKRGDIRLWQAKKLRGIHSIQQLHPTQLRLAKNNKKTHSGAVARTVTISPMLRSSSSSSEEEEDEEAPAPTTPPTVRKESKGIASTGNPFFSHASNPPFSGRTFRNPFACNCRTICLAVASFGHTQYTTTSCS